MKDIKSILGKLDSLASPMLTESEQVSITPAQSNTQVIKQGDKVVGTVTNPALAAQLKSAIGKGEMSLNNTDNLNQLQETETEYTEGDRVTVTGDVQMSGQSGTVDALGIGGKFVIVKFDDGSKHSFHSSDLSPEEESDEDDDGFGFMSETSNRKEVLRKNSEYAKSVMEFVQSTAPNVSIEDRLFIMENYATHDGILVESSSADKVSQFEKLYSMSDASTIGKTYTYVCLMLVGDRILPVCPPQTGKLVKSAGNQLTFEKNGSSETYPRSSELSKSISKTFIFSDGQKFKKFATAVALWFDFDVGTSPKNPDDQGVAEGEMTEVAAPGQEDWIKANKSKFIKQYGKDKGMSVLYATANKRAKKVQESKINKTMRFKHLMHNPHTEVLWPNAMFESRGQGNEVNAAFDKYRMQPLPKPGSSCILSMPTYTGDEIMVWYGTAKFDSATDDFYVLDTASGKQRYNKKTHIVFPDKKAYDKFVAFINLKFCDQSCKFTEERTQVMENTDQDRSYDDFESWKHAVSAYYPGKKFKFSGRMEGGKQTISAEIPGEDRSYGVWDQDAENGVVLTEMDKKSFIGKIRRGVELSKKVKSSWQDAVDAETKGDAAGASKAFKRHVKYANLEHPGTWRAVKPEEPISELDASTYQRYIDKKKQTPAPTKIGQAGKDLVNMRRARELKASKVNKDAKQALGDPRYMEETESQAKPRQTHPFKGGRKTHTITKKHVPLIWEEMLGTVTARDPDSPKTPPKYFDYNWDAARAHAKVDQCEDLRICKSPGRCRGWPERGKTALWGIFNQESLKAPTPSSEEGPVRDAKLAQGDARYMKSAVVEGRAKRTSTDFSPIGQLKQLNQPVGINGGSYTYWVDVTKTPLKFVASDGSEVKEAKTLKDIAKWMDKWVAEIWLEFLDGSESLDTLRAEDIIRTKKGRGDQAEHEAGMLEEGKPKKSTKTDSAKQKKTAAAGRLVKESAGASDTLSHILNKFKHEVKQFELGEEIDSDLYDALFDYWADAGDIPYGVAKGRDGDPVQWVSDKLSDLLLNETQDEGMNMATPDMQFEAWDRELTNLLNEGLTVSTSTGNAGGLEDSVTVSATGPDANDIVQILKAAGIGHLGSSDSDAGQEVSAYGAPINPDAAGSVDSSGDYESEEGDDLDAEGDDIMSMIKQMFGGQGAEVEVVGADASPAEADGEEECEAGDEGCDSDDAEGSEEDEKDKEEVDEAYANEPDTSEADLDYIMKTISGGMNKQKRDQTVGNPTKVAVTESEGASRQAMLQALEDYWYEHQQNSDEDVGDIPGAMEYYRSMSNDDLEYEYEKKCKGVNESEEKTDIPPSIARAMKAEGLPLTAEGYKKFTTMRKTEPKKMGATAQKEKEPKQGELFQESLAQWLKLSGIKK